MENAVDVFWHGEVTSVSTIFKNCPNPHVWSPSALPTHQITMKLSLRHFPGRGDTFTHLTWHVKMFSGFAAALWSKKLKIEKCIFWRVHRSKNPHWAQNECYKNTFSHLWWTTLLKTPKLTQRRVCTQLTGQPSSDRWPPPPRGWPQAQPREREGGAHRNRSRLSPERSGRGPASRLPFKALTAGREWVSPALRPRCSTAIKRGSALFENDVFENTNPLIQGGAHRYASWS